MTGLLVFLRHLIAIAALPFAVTVIIPIWLSRRYQVELPDWRSTPVLSAVVGGLCLLAIGLFLFVHSLRRFAVDGRGTLAPWDPPRHLVVRGPYRYVRNPMISGVVFVLFGEALTLLSTPHFLWALTFLAFNAVFIPLFEEPQLRHRFGASYVDYCAHVPRLVPLFHPWNPVRPPVGPPDRTQESGR